MRRSAFLNGLLGATICGGAMAVAMYAIGVFTALDWNPAHWDAPARAMIAIMVCGAAFLGLFALVDD